MSRTRIFWISLALIAGAYVALGLSRISLNVDILRLLPSHFRQVEGLSLFLKHFAQPNELIVTISAPDPGTAETVADELAATLRQHSPLVKNATAQPPWEKDPASLSEFLTFLLLNQSEDAMAEIQRRIAPDQADNTLRETLDTLQTSVSPRDVALLSYDPFGLSLALPGSEILGGKQQSEFSSDDGKFRVVYVEAAHPFANYKQTDRWLAQIRAICDGVVSSSPVTLEFTGEPAFVAEISTGMEWDMASSAAITLILISGIFWLCYRRIAPLFWLTGMLLLTFALSLATAGLFLNQITVIGVGFASVMIGLSVDYGYLIYQKSLRATGTARDLQWQCLRNIAWTASTTAAAFFALNLSSLPGLSQLGSMVGLGVCVGALVMLVVFAPLAARLRPATPPPPTGIERLLSSPRFVRLGEWVALGMAALLLGGLLVKGFPETDFSAATFRARQSKAQSALENLYKRLTDDRGLLSLIVTGKDEAQTLGRLRRGQARMDDAIRQGMAKHFFSPLPLWPDSVRQRDNLALLGSLSKELPRLKSALIENGFTEAALTLTAAVFEQASSWQQRPLPIWPENETSRWILRRLARHQEGNFLAIGMVEPVVGREIELADAFQDDGIFLVSWSALGTELQRAMPREILQVSLGLLLGILLILSIGLRSARAVILFAATTALILLCLAGAMSLLNMKWGFFNIAAILLLLGTGTDYGVLLLLALRRNGGDTLRARQDLGLVIFLCCTSTAAGFGSLAWANNMGLAALGKTCALGLLIDGMIFLFLLPRAWTLWMPAKPATESAPSLK